MIESVNSALAAFTAASGSGAAGSSSTSDDDAFDAALAAAKKKEASQQAQKSEFDEIREKGFTAWARDVQVEALKEKLRQQVMAEMGLDEKSLSSMSKAVQDALEQKIQDEVDKRLEEQLAKGDGTTDGSATTQAVTAQAGKNDRAGKDVPVIAAASWPGAASLF